MARVLVFLIANVSRRMLAFGPLGDRAARLSRILLLGAISPLEEYRSHAWVYIGAVVLLCCFDFIYVGYCVFSFLEPLEATNLTENVPHVRHEVTSRSISPYMCHRSSPS